MTKHKEALEALEDLLHEAQTQGVWSSLNVSRAETIRQALQAASWQPMSTPPTAKGDYLIQTEFGDNLLSAKYDGKGKSFWIYSLGDIEPWPFKNTVKWMAAPVDGGG